MKKIAIEDLGELFAAGLNIKADIVPVIDENDEEYIMVCEL